MPLLVETSKPTFPAKARHAFNRYEAPTIPKVFVREQGFWAAHVTAGSFVRRRIPVQFRIVAGERRAENQQTERLVYRTITRGVRVAISKALVLDKVAFERSNFWRSLYESGNREPVAGHFHIHLGEPPAGLREENEKLKGELSQLRRLLATKSAQATTTQTPSPLLDDRSYSVAELLALIDDDEVEQLANVLDSKGYDINSVVKKLGVERAIRFSNLLGRSRVAVADGAKLVVTTEGTALGSALSDLALPRARDNGRKEADQKPS